MNEKNLNNYSIEITISSSNPIVKSKLLEIKDHITLQINDIIKPVEDSKKKSIQKCFIEMIMNTTIHALPKILTTDKMYFKIMWLLFFIISFGFNFQLVTKCIIDYLSYETITKIGIGFDQPGNLNLI
jgi:hypothetical protein